MGVLMDIWGKKLSQPTIEAYWDAVRLYDIGRFVKACAKIVKTRSTGMYFPSPADIIAEIVEIEPEQKMLAAPKPEEERPLTPEEQSRYDLNWGFMLYCIERDHTPPNGVEGWKRERDQFVADVHSGKIKLSRNRKTGNLIVDALNSETKGDSRVRTN